MAKVINNYIVVKQLLLWNMNMNMDSHGYG